MGLGVRLKEILKKQGLTIKELSEMSGVSINTLYSITKRDNNMARYDIVDKIAAALGISIEELTGQNIDHNKIENIKNARLHEAIRHAENEPSSDRIMNVVKVFSGTDTPAICFDNNEYTDEELEEIQKFAEFIKSKRKNSEK